MQTSEVPNQEKHEIMTFVASVNEKQAVLRAGNRTTKRIRMVIAFAFGAVVGHLIYLNGGGKLGIWSGPFMGGLCWFVYTLYSGMLGGGLDYGSDVKRQAKKLLLECNNCSRLLDLSAFRCGTCRSENYTDADALVSPFTGCRYFDCDQPLQAGFRCAECGHIFLLDEDKIREPSRFSDNGDGIALVRKPTSVEEVAEGVFGLAAGLAEVLHPKGFEGAVQDVAEHFQKETSDRVDLLKAQAQKKRDDRWKAAGVERNKEETYDESDDMAAWFEDKMKR